MQGSTSCYREVETLKTDHDCFLRVTLFCVTLVFTNFMGMGKEKSSKSLDTKRTWRCLIIHIEMGGEMKRVDYNSEDDVEEKNKNINQSFIHVHEQNGSETWTYLSILKLEENKKYHSYMLYNLDNVLIHMNW